MTVRTLAWETAAKTHESEAIVEALLGRQDESRRHLMAAIALAQEARYERALTTSRAPTPGELTHLKHDHTRAGCPQCDFERGDTA